MSDHVVIEEPLQFGEGGRLFGILTQPGVPHRYAQELPAFVFLNAGLLHRVGPRGLYVRLARNLAEIGFTSLRVDLAGYGDSLPSRYLMTEQTLAEDYKEIVSVLESRLGRSRLVLGGICSAADDAIRLTPKDSRIVGMVLLDPVCDRDDGFAARDLMMKYTYSAKYVAGIKRRLKTSATPFMERWKRDPALTLRDSPDRQQTRAAFQSVRERQGRVFSLITNYADTYYNQEGQMGRVLEVEGYDQFCTEIFWPWAEHTYPLELHRRRLIQEIMTWAAGYIPS